MTLMGVGDTVPPNLRTPAQIVGDQLPPEDMQDIDCLAVGTYMETAEFGLEILSVCQRPSNPCIVEIEYKVVGDGVYDLEEPWTAFSLNSTNGIDGTWHRLEPLNSDPRHTTTETNQYGTGDRIRSEGGTKTERFVANMCNHVSTFMEDANITFRLSWRNVSGFYSPGDGLPIGLR